MTDAISRRGMLKLLSLAPALSAFYHPLPSRAAAAPRSDWRKLLLAGERTITLRRDGVCGSRTLRYVTAGGELDVEGYTQLCLSLRDTRANRVYPISVRTLDILCGLQRWGAANNRFLVINALSGFRTASTNDMTEGASKVSLHMQGRAIDFGLDGVPTSQASAMTVAYNEDGGVGLYPNRHFIHADDGHPRIWVDPRARRSR